MNDRHEAARPGPDAAPLLHPTDLPHARGLFTRGWWFGRLCSIPVIVAIAVVIWTITGQLLAAGVGALGTLMIALVAHRGLTSRAWGDIPHARRLPQDPPRWLLWATLIDAVALMITAVALILAVRTHPVDAGVVVFATGAAVGIAALQAGELIVGLTRGSGGSLATRRLVLLLAVTASAVGLGLAGADIAGADATGADAVWGGRAVITGAMGAASTILAYALWWATGALRGAGASD